MHWAKTNNFIKGDHVRVSRKYYYHHGIYVGDNKMIHYTATNNDGITDPRNVRIKLTTLDFFLKGGVGEKAIYSPEELNNVYPVEKILSNAYSHLNEEGYNLITHNCEDFAIECIHIDPSLVKTQVTSVTNKIIDLFKH